MAMIERTDYSQPPFETSGFFTATHFPNPEVRAQAAAQQRDVARGLGHQVGTRSGPSQDQVGAQEAQAEAQGKLTSIERTVLASCRDARRSKQARVAPAGNPSRTGNFNRPELLDAGLIEPTIPDSRRSPRQRYRTTERAPRSLSRTEKDT